MKIREEFTSPLELCFDRIKGKWKPIILWQLKSGPMQPSSLQRNIKGINQKMLLEQLRELKESKIIDKISYDGYPVKVEYFLTDIGKEIIRGLEVFQNVGEKYLKISKAV
ncbi:winged helix-turn-helix transcriptional regulator [Clostridium fallax]|uniref:Transcriptional regulator, HxlR family n=1 Tax=Clostridium fallax TaxID=1533 RepID=A0A1M4Z9Q9_9CLOT|nr:helix-turn-helix domain-containing protein [Clostridium fallax]SHF14803.1 transcriptional regulator, HxlR family [Clostridium fallax]SQB06440.1 transcriptional regulator [Clostridium fallax]